MISPVALQPVTMSQKVHDILHRYPYELVIATQRVSPTDWSKAGWNEDGWKLHCDPVFNIFQKIAEVAKLEADTKAFDFIWLHGHKSTAPIPSFLRVLSPGQVNIGRKKHWVFLDLIQDTVWGSSIDLTRSTGVVQ